MLKSIKISDMEFVIQSYLANEYVYLVSTKKDFPSIRVEFWQKDPSQMFSSNMKTGKQWRQFVDAINIDELKTKLCGIFNQSNKGKIKINTGCQHYHRKRLDSTDIYTYYCEDCRTSF